MCSSCCNRRKLLKRSLQTISLLALGSCQKSSSLVSPIDLRAQESSKIQADTLQVLAVRGIAQTQKLLKVGDQVFSGEVVELDKDSEMILGAPDKSAFQLNSHVKVRPILVKKSEKSTWKGEVSQLPSLRKEIGSTNFECLRFR